MTHARVAERTERMSKFTVYDRHGNVWPPGFRCSLDIEDDKRASKKDMQVPLAASNEARAAGKGWAGGTLHHMQKPLLAKAAP